VVGWFWVDVWGRSSSRWHCQGHFRASNTVGAKCWDLEAEG
jgi:hypothetical protein